MSGGKRPKLACVKEGEASGLPGVHRSRPPRPDLSSLAEEIIRKLDMVAIYLRHTREGKRHSSTQSDVEELKQAWDTMVRAVEADKYEPDTLFHEDNPSSDSA